jgi:rod shape-determining protein MreD
MTRVAGIGIMVGATLLQVTWAPRLGLLGAFPNLVLVAVVCITWTAGARAGLLWASIGGLLLDLTAPGPLGPHALGLLVGAFITGFWVRNVDSTSLVLPALAAAVATAVYSLILVGADDTLGLPVPPLQLAAQLAVAACIYNAVLVPPALLMARRLRSPAVRAA